MAGTFVLFLSQSGHGIRSALTKNDSDITRGGRLCCSSNAHMLMSWVPETASPSGMTSLGHRRHDSPWAHPQVPEVGGKREA